MDAIPVRKLFDVNEYELMIKAGVFVGKENYELIEGEIVKKMVQGHAHISCVMRLTSLLVPTLLNKAIVSVQNAVIINEFSEPEPDITLLKFRADFYASGKATAEDVLLIIEVADTTTSYDRQRKMPLYARAGVPESWLVNLQRKVLEVNREPQNGKYQVTQKLTRNESVTPLLLPDLTLKVSEVIA